MSEELKKNTNNTTEQNNQMKLDDAARVKVMSPSQLVFKRFIRNKLAVVGFIILAVMFLFAFVGPIFTPYREDEQFNYDSKEFLVFAEFKMANDYVYYLEPNSTYTNSLARRATAQLSGMTTDCKLLKYTASQTEEKYIAKKLGTGSYLICSGEEIATYNRSSLNEYTRTSDNAVEDAIFNEMVANVNSKGTCYFTCVDAATGVAKEYLAYEEPANVNAASGDVKSVVTLCTPKVECLASTLVFHDVVEGNVSKLNDADKSAICKAYYESLVPGAIPTVQTTAGAATIVSPNASGEMIVKINNADYAMVSNYVINAKNSGEFISADIKQAIAGEAIVMDKDSVDNGSVDYGETKEGAKITYKIQRVTDNYTATVKTYKISKEALQKKMLITTAPSSKHILGTDTTAMDVMTRLMYGGRVSLMVGFVVVFIQIFIGIILGGIAGYFSGWVDVIIMRIIELFNCIPFYPMMMIIGSVLDANEVSADARIFLLMALLGILSWPGIARIVRGQILSLREQDFIVATEACGIPINRRIFKHLIPNVIPLLIVNATMSLGGIIITEATLSFLGLGVKYPAASWGSIINQAQDAFVLQSYPWIWIPAGLLILLTVLGFNFVGDGLRDAFDPKMKR